MIRMYYLFCLNQNGNILYNIKLYKLMSVEDKLEML